MSGLLLLRRPHLQPLPRCLSSAAGLLLSQPQPQPQARRRYALIGKPQVKSEPVWTLPGTPARTRFAPSPTGYLHLGSLRTALFNYLLAQATGGQFILRLEDTDQARFVHDAEQRLYEDLQWAGLNWDEGPDKGGSFGPYKQSLRLDLYRQHAHQLLESGRAFRCFCSKDDLEFNVRQATASGHAAHYPGTCRGIVPSESDRRAANGEPHTVRFKAAETPVTAPDLVYGAYKKAEREDDFIIMKSDGFPTYHFANVVDDHFMDITHVIRGAEWLISTPKHVELYNAFGWQPPNFAHVGLLVDMQRQKLSKRDIDNIGVSVYRKNNILPEALLNYAVLLGWDPNLQNKPNLDKRGVMTMEDMKNNFTLKFTRGDIVVDLAKLKFFQTRFTRDLLKDGADTPYVRSRLAQPLLTQLKRIQEDLLTEGKQLGGLSPEEAEDFFAGVENNPSLASQITEDYVIKVLQAYKGPMDSPFEWVCRNIWAFYPVPKGVLRKSFLEMQESVARIMITQDEKRILHADVSKVIHWFRQQLVKIEWNAEAVGNETKRITDAISFYDTDAEKLKDKSAGWKILRWALFNGESWLSVVPVMMLLGRDETLQRLRLARKAAFAEEERLNKARNLEKRPAESTNGGDIISRTFNDGLAETVEPRNVKVLASPIQRGLRSISYQTGASGSWEEDPWGESSAADLKGPFVSSPPGLNRKEPKDVEKPYRIIDFDTWRRGNRSMDLGREQEEDDKGRAPAFWELRATLGHSNAKAQDVQGQTAGGNAKKPAPVSNNLPKPPTDKTGPFKVGEPILDHAEHVQQIKELHVAISKERARKARLAALGLPPTTSPRPPQLEPPAGPGSDSGSGSYGGEKAPAPDSKTRRSGRGKAPHPAGRGPMWTEPAFGGIPPDIAGRIEKKGTMLKWAGNAQRSLRRVIPPQAPPQETPSQEAPSRETPSQELPEAALLKAVSRNLQTKVEKSAHEATRQNDNES